MAEGINPTTSLRFVLEAQAALATLTELKKKYDELIVTVGKLEKETGLDSEVEAISTYGDQLSAAITKATAAAKELKKEFGLTQGLTKESADEIKGLSSEIKTLTAGINASERSVGKIEAQQKKNIAERLALRKKERIELEKRAGATYASFKKSSAVSLRTLTDEDRKATLESLTEYEKLMKRVYTKAKTGGQITPAAQKSLNEELAKRVENERLLFLSRFEAAQKQSDNRIHRNRLDNLRRESDISKGTLTVASQEIRHRDGSDEAVLAGWQASEDYANRRKAMFEALAKDGKISQEQAARQIELVERAHQSRMLTLEETGARRRMEAARRDNKELVDEIKVARERYREAVKAVSLSTDEKSRSENVQNAIKASQVLHDKQVELAKRGGADLANVETAANNRLAAIQKQHSNQRVAEAKKVNQTLIDNVEDTQRTLAEAEKAIPLAEGSGQVTARAVGALKRYHKARLDEISSARDKELITFQQAAERRMALDIEYQNRLEKIHSAARKTKEKSDKDAINRQTNLVIKQIGQNVELNESEKKLISTLAQKVRSLDELTMAEKRLMKVVIDRHRTHKSLSEEEKDLVKAADKYNSVFGEQSEAMLRLVHAAKGAWLAISRFRNFALLAAFATRPLVNAIRNSMNSYIEYEEAIQGTISMGHKFNVSTEQTHVAVSNLTSDGIFKLTDATKALRNLMSTGIGLDQSIKTLNALRDAAAFNRQGTLEYGEAIVGATDGIKNMISRMVDNAGITKNISNILKEQAALYGLNTEAMSEQQKVMLITQGIIKEATVFQGDAARMSNTAAGSVDKMAVAVERANKAFGEMITNSLLFKGAVGAIGGAAKLGELLILEAMGKTDRLLLEQASNAGINGSPLTALTSQSVIEKRNQATRSSNRFDSRHTISNAAMRATYGDSLSSLQREYDEIQNRNKRLIEAAGDNISDISIIANRWVEELRPLFKKAREMNREITEKAIAENPELARDLLKRAVTVESVLSEVEAKALNKSLLELSDAAMVTRGNLLGLGDVSGIFDRIAEEGIEIFNGEYANAMEQHKKRMAAIKASMTQAGVNFEGTGIGDAHNEAIDIYHTQDRLGIEAIDAKQDGRILSAKVQQIQAEADRLLNNSLRSVSKNRVETINVERLINENISAIQRVADARKDVIENEFQELRNVLRGQDGKLIDDMNRVTVGDLERHLASVSRQEGREGITETELRRLREVEMVDRTILMLTQLRTNEEQRQAQIESVSDRLRIEAGQKKLSLLQKEIDLTNRLIELFLKQASAQREADRVRASIQAAFKLPSAATVGTGSSAAPKTIAASSPPVAPVAAASVAPTPAAAETGSPAAPKTLAASSPPVAPVAAASVASTPAAAETYQALNQALQSVNWRELWVKSSSPENQTLIAEYKSTQDRIKRDDEIRTAYLGEMFKRDPDTNEFLGNAGGRLVFDTENRKAQQVLSMAANEGGVSQDYLLNNEHFGWNSPTQGGRHIDAILRLLNDKSVAGIDMDAHDTDKQRVKKIEAMFGRNGGASWDMLTGKDPDEYQQMTLLKMFEEAGTLPNAHTLLDQVTERLNERLESIRNAYNPTADTEAVAASSSPVATVAAASVAPTPAAAETGSPAAPETIAASSSPVAPAAPAPVASAPATTSTLATQAGAAVTPNAPEGIAASEFNFSQSARDISKTISSISTATASEMGNIYQTLGSQLDTYGQESYKMAVLLAEQQLAEAKKNANGNGEIIAIAEKEHTEELAKAETERFEIISKYSKEAIALTLQRYEQLNQAIVSPMNNEMANNALSSSELKLQEQIGIAKNSGVGVATVDSLNARRDEYIQTQIKAAELGSSEDFSDEKIATLTLEFKEKFNQMIIGYLGNVIEKSRESLATMTEWSQELGSSMPLEMRTSISSRNIDQRRGDLEARIRANPDFQSGEEGQLNKQGQTLLDSINKKAGRGKKAEARQLRVDDVMDKTEWITRMNEVGQAWTSQFGNISKAARKMGMNLDKELRVMNGFISGAGQIATSIQAGMAAGGPVGVALAAPGIIGGIAQMINGFGGDDEKKREARRSRSFGTTINRGPTQYTIAPTISISNGGDVYVSQDGPEALAKSVAQSVAKEMAYNGTA